ncbi:glucose-1-phosphate cytidylyltransferase [Candidatus Endobugula sertula]|uniref:Glucose-1-phosphate cytidylyltransferase n=1 Tax=Candidatus Endobugula sertula TaxID=62101 RepID=A0A1D2QPH7_9GAMM|nr:glucose-1-phosphate cytidylyltransferase [Candidatus Endobugula sertula]
MKAVILAGGYGTRISEETELKPKPMVQIGGKPILWHIMKLYSSYGINDFVICCGYKGYVIKEYFANYFLHMSDVTFDLSNNSFHLHNQRSESWVVTLVDTGEGTMTGGRLRRVSDYVKDEESFCLTYGDGVADINIKKLIDFHNSHGKKATVTAVVPPGRFGVLEVDDRQRVLAFQEKPKNEVGRINGGFFVLSPKIIDLIEGDSTIFEGQPLEELAGMGELAAFYHDGFWQPMDTLRDMRSLESLWGKGKAPWRLW